MRLKSRRASYALLGSLLLHGALLAWLFTHREPAPTVAVSTPIELEVIEAPPVAKPRPAPPPVPPLAPKKVASASPKTSRAKPSRIAEAPSAPAPAPARSAPAIAAAPAPSSGPEVPAAPKSAGHLPDLAAAGTRAAGRVAEDALALDRPPALQDPDDRSIQAPFVVDDENERVNGMLREALGRDRVERGMVDPYFKQLGDKMASAWKPEKLVDEKGMKGFLEETARGLKTGAADWMNAWSQAAEQYGKTGNPGYDGNPYDIDGRLRDNIPAGVTQYTPHQLQSTRIALVRLTQQPDGHLLHVELVQPSIDPLMDHEIMRELRSGEMVMPVPPVKGQGIHNPIRSVWAFQLTVSIAPPVPMLSGAFDLDALFDKKMREEMGGKIVDVRMPLSRRITKRVDLVSVE